MIIKYPLSTEKSIRQMEAENKLVFIVDKEAVNTLIDKKYDLKKSKSKMLVDSYDNLMIILSDEQKNKLKDTMLKIYKK